MREAGVFTDRHGLRDAANADQARGSSGLVGQDGQLAVDLERIGRHDLGAEAIRELLRDGRLPGGSRAEDGEHLGV